MVLGLGDVNEALGVDWKWSVWDEGERDWRLVGVSAGVAGLGGLCALLLVLGVLEVERRLVGVCLSSVVEELDWAMWSWRGQAADSEQLLSWYGRQCGTAAAMALDAILDECWAELGLHGEGKLDDFNVWGWPTHGPKPFNSVLVDLTVFFPFPLLVSMGLGNKVATDKDSEYLTVAAGGTERLLPKDEQSLARPRVSRAPLASGRVGLSTPPVPRRPRKLPGQPNWTPVAHLHNNSSADTPQRQGTYYEIKDMPSLPNL